ncbi:type II toxin-antitoxin system RelE/ParE family toxin [Paenibacillus mesotrionivorans]|uniref:Type II toxin-antitoxin system RelE/ParE family toxin n=1 Tax=Paenibacillus mesotrionivorans TaxID=3160968 RepID=A0ACC7PAE5_9BACL
MDYIYLDSPSYAFSFLSDVMERVRTLDVFPYRGRLVPEINVEDVREVFIHRYRLVYQVEESRIIILTFVHGAMNWSGQNLLK